MGNGIFRLRCALGAIAIALAAMAPAAGQQAPAKQPAATPWPNGAAPTAPPGFTVTAFARIDTSTGWMAVSGNGDVFLSEPATGNILLLRDTTGVGRADLVTTFATGFSRPHGLILRGGYLYVADVPDVWRIPVTEGALTGGPRERVTPPGQADAGMARDVEFDRRGRVYVGFASRENAAEARAPDGTVQLLDRGTLSTFASGLQTVAGMATYPGTDDLFVTANRRAASGDAGSADFLALVRRGQSYGSPARAKRSAGPTEPLLYFEPRSFPMELVFYRGSQFPARYRHGAFVALHGGWDAGSPKGYSIVYLPFRGRKPTGKVAIFVKGFWGKSGDSRSLWGRPAGLAIARDGSLLISDDVGRTVWRVVYTGR
ncbi:MAG: hypothetical protein WDN44_05980 [Sphingomonas sp.]